MVAHTHLLLPLRISQNGTLQDLIEHMQEAGQPLNETKILELFLSACKGLQSMHTCTTGPIAHRDIKVSVYVIPDPTNRTPLKWCTSIFRMLLNLTSNPGHSHFLQCCILSVDIYGSVEMKHHWETFSDCLLLIIGGCGMPQFIVNKTE